MRALLSTRDLSIGVDHARRHERMMEIAGKYRRGDTVQEIADDYGITKATVLRIARMNNLPKRSKKVFSPELRAAALEAHKRGEPLKSIAAKFGVSEAWISMEAKKFGLQRYNV